jgi:hypothetical protein
VKRRVLVVVHRFDRRRRRRRGGSCLTVGDGGRTGGFTSRPSNFRRALHTRPSILRTALRTSGRIMPVAIRRTISLLVMGLLLAANTPVPWALSSSNALWHEKVRNGGVLGLYPFRAERGTIPKFFFRFTTPSCRVAHPSTRRGTLETAL